MEKIMPTFRQLFESLPKEKQTEAIKEELEKYYEREKLIMDNYAEQSYDPKIIMNTFREAGSQSICEFSVLDLKKEHKPGQVNFHLQNTSQWLYAGAIVVHDNKVSSHH